MASVGDQIAVSVIPRDSRLYVAGHTGMVGSAIMRRLEAEGFTNILTTSWPGRAFRSVNANASCLDLRDQWAVNSWFSEYHPEIVVLAAARVGGILANATYPANFLYDNLAIQTNVIHAAYVFGVQRLLFLGSSCIYPRDCPQPIREEYLLTGTLEKTNEAYAVAKIAGLKMVEYYRKQYGCDFIAAMPTNLYGPNDNFDLETAHVLPALVRKFHEAKLRDETQVTVWGTGTPRREFLHVDDLADACVFLLENFDPATGSGDEPVFLNVGTGEDVTIRELADQIRIIVHPTVHINWDATKPDGTPRKQLDVHRLRSRGWTAKIGLFDGIRMTYESYRSLMSNENRDGQ